MPCMTDNRNEFPQDDVREVLVDLRRRLEDAERRLDRLEGSEWVRGRSGPQNVSERPEIASREVL